MKVLMVLGPYAGQVVEWDTPVAETLIGTGEAEPYTDPERYLGLDGEGWSDAGNVTVVDPVDLNTFTVAQLEDMGDVHNIEAVDIDGTGADGGVVKADWVRVLEVATGRA